MRRERDGWLILAVGLWQAWKSPGAATGTIFKEQIDVRTVRIVGSAAVA